MKDRNFLRAKKAIDQVQSDLERRKRGRQEYRPDRSEREPSKVQPTTYVVNQVQQKTGFSKKQTCFLMVLTAILTAICICVSPFVINYYFGPLSPPTPITKIVPTVKPTNQTNEGLVFSQIRLTPFMADNPIVKPGQGNWWRLEVTVENRTSKPINLRGYDIVLRDSQGREFWYDRNLSMFGVNDGFIKQLNPGVKMVFPVVFDLPETLAGLTMHYDGAIVSIGPDQIVK